MVTTGTREREILIRCARNRWTTWLTVVWHDGSRPLAQAAVYSSRTTELGSGPLIEH